MSPRANRLAGETSPYLLQHAHNPVDWYPWGEEALARARAEDRPLLLSIGYSACHWCHVMERESFEDARIAGLMNAHFVCVKVDREERPDLDEIYMAATQAMNQGQGGWPMTVFLTPELEPIYTGTYFPPEDRWGRPGFATVLGAIARAWREDRAALHTQASRVTAHLRELAAASTPPSAIGDGAFQRAVEQLGRDFDPQWGGFGGAPKFPPATTVRLLLKLHRRLGDPHALEMARRTLGGMARGGIYDHLGGAFARYSVDERWHVPHFEKMLYDNALLAVAFLEGFQATGDRSFARVAAETLDWALAEMSTPEGGFASSTDADSEGEEGRYFVWTTDELREYLSIEEAAAAAAFWDVRSEGNWEDGKNVLRVLRPLEEVAAELGIDLADLESRLGTARSKLADVRSRRVPPGRDDKVLTGWNGLLIRALADGHRVLGEEARGERWLEAARRAADFLLAALRRPDGGLFRTFRNGRARHDAVLEDYAYLADGLLALYEAGGRRADLDAARELAERILSDFADRERGGFFHTAASHEPLLVRFREGTDGATPAPNAVAASVLARLAVHLGRDDLRRAAEGAVAAWGEPAARWPRAFAATLEVADFLQHGPVELVFVGTAGDPGLPALRRAAARVFLPARVEAVADPADGAATRDLPLFEDRGLVDGLATVYACRRGTCLAPVTDPAQVAAALRSA